MNTSDAPLAIEGGRPVRATLLPYGRQQLDDDDRRAVLAALESDWLTTGPKVAEFEAAFAAAVGAEHAVAVSSGTAALHAALHVLDLQPGDEVIVPTLTFAATANAVVYCGAKPVFADVDPGTLLVDEHTAAAVFTPRTRALVAVDYAGQPCDYDALRAWASDARIHVVADACHSLGAKLHGRPAGTLARLSCFSLHPVKAMTTGEGGVITTSDSRLAERMRRFRHHGLMATDSAAKPWDASQVELGCNYRLTDFQCALGISQLAKLPGWIERRRQLALSYYAELAYLQELRPLPTSEGRDHAWHLFVVELALERLRADRDTILRALRAEGVAAQVHYRPVHLQPYYRERFGTQPGLCPIAERAAERVLSLPLYPAMTDADQDDVVLALGKIIRHFRRERDIR